MRFDTIENIRAAGFTGFVTVANLQATNCAEVPREQGVYMLLYPSTDTPAFLEINPTRAVISRAGVRREPTVPISILEGQWIIASPVIYIGKAGTTLQKRLSKYMKHGMGKTEKHWGGRYIWQLRDSANLLVCWKPTLDEEPAQVETALIQSFKAQYGQRPFANLRD